MKVIKVFLIMMQMIIIVACDQLPELLGEEEEELDLQINSINTNYSNGNVEIEWDFIGDADRYEVEFSENENGPFSSLSEVFSNSYTHTGVNRGQYYYYRIRAISGDGTVGDYSYIASVYTQDNNNGNDGNGDGGTDSSNATQIYEVGSWQFGSVDTDAARWYYLNVNPGEVIDFVINDADSGGGGNNGNVDITLYREDQNTIYTGMVGISSSDNTDIRVTIADGDMRLYIKFTGLSSGNFSFRPNRIVLSDETRLGNPQINEGAINISPDFSSDIFNYTININEQTDSVVFEEIYGLDFNADIEVTLDNQDLTFTDNSFTIDAFTIYVTKILEITVTSSDGSASDTYTFEITQASSNNTISSLVFSAGTLDLAFNMDQGRYTLTIPGSVTDLTVTPTAEDENAIITVNNVQVNSGDTSNAIQPDIGTTDNGFIINIEAPDGSSSNTYYIDIEKQLTGDFELEVSNAVSIEYDVSTKTYTVETETGYASASIEITPDDSTASVTIDGNPLTYDNVELNGNYTEVSVPVTVTPDNGNGTTENFTIKITPSWTNDSPGDQAELFYGFDVETGKEYSVQWDDLVNGSGAYSDDVVVTLYREDQSTAISSLENQNSGYSNPVTITAANTETYYLKVVSLDGDNVGEFGIRVFNVTDDQWVTFKATGSNSVVVK